MASDAPVCTIYERHKAILYLGSKICESGNDCVAQETLAEPGRRRFPRKWTLHNVHTFLPVCWRQHSTLRTPQRTLFCREACLVSISRSSSGLCQIFCSISGKAGNRWKFWWLEEGETFSSNLDDVLFFSNKLNDADVAWKTKVNQIF